MKTTLHGRESIGARLAAIISAFARALERVGDLALQVFDVLFPVQPPPALPAPKPPAPIPPPPPPPAPDGFLIGTSMDSKQDVYALSQQMDRHVLIMGATGCGKTTLVSRMFTEEILKWQ